MTNAVSESTGIQFAQANSLLERVMGYQNPAVVCRIMDKVHLDLKSATLLFDDTKRFLYLCGIKAKGDPSIAPPEGVDAGWHEFLLFTEDYQQFCELYFGRFIHHRPRRPEDPTGDGTIMRHSRQLALATFGALSSNWNIGRKDENSDSECNDNCSMSTNCQDAECN